MPSRVTQQRIHSQSHRKPRRFSKNWSEINWINYHDKHKVSVRLFVFAVCKTRIFRAFLFVCFLHCCLVWDLSHRLCLCCAQQEEGSVSGETVEATAYRSNNRKERGSKEERERRGRGRLGTQSRSLTNIVPPKGRKKYEYRWHNLPRGAVYRMLRFLLRDHEVFTAII